MRIEDNRLFPTTATYSKLADVLWRAAIDAEREQDTSWWDCVRVVVEHDEAQASIDLSATVIRTYHNYLGDEELERISIEELWVEGWSADGEAIDVDFDSEQLERSRIDVGYRLK